MPKFQATAKSATVALLALVVSMHAVAIVAAFDHICLAKTSVNLSMHKMKFFIEIFKSLNFKLPKIKRLI